MDPVWIPLQGEGGGKPKAPAVNGWQSPSFTGVDADYNGWLGMRADDIVVVDCDSKAAAKFWTELHPETTWTRKTPRGYHFIYQATDGSPTGPAVAVYPGIDIRAGAGSYIVFKGPGYETIKSQLALRSFDASWLPERRVTNDDVDEWSEMPEGRGNNTMAAIAGALRKQGMSMEVIYATLKGINKLTMTRAPMGDDEIRQIALSISRYEPAPDIDIEFEPDEVEEAHPDVPRGFISSKHMTLPGPPEWLWKPYLPKGRLVMLDGQESIGKGMFCAWAAVKTVSGAAFPGEQGTPAPRPVLWFTCEDDPEEDILRRLLAAGYDPAVHAPVLFLDPRAKRPHFPSERSWLRKVCDEVQPGLVVMDPGRSYLAPENGNVEMNFNNEAALRPGLEALMFLAHDLKLLFLFVHHWNKIEDGSTRTKMGGSGSFLQVVRHRVTLAQVGLHRALSVEKSNIADKTYTVRSFDIEPNEQFDAAEFKVGGALTAYRDLDEWIDVTRKLEKEGGPEIIVVIDSAEAAWHYSYLDKGDLAPSVADIAKDLCVSQEEAISIRAALVDQGIIDHRKRWVGQPVGNHRRQVVDHDES